jgi:non-specific serine/threonine protein kinase/serine/threonine-protein kinase
MSTEPAPAFGEENQGDGTRTFLTPDLAPGFEIGVYRIVAQLGEGGMGVVYQARQSQPIRREVALKIIKPGMDSRQVIARFESERQALAVMDHTNIARVFDAGATATGLPYFVMELVQGESITRYCDARRLTVAQRIALFIPVCRAIQHAHQKGILHRDLKPSNILVTEQDGKPVPKVIDFGLAKALGPQLGEDTRVTNVGMVLGTLDYMSPEQADFGRHDVDTRSDVYSLGAVLYELLAGSTPLEREKAPAGGYLESLRRIRDEESPPPSARVRRSNSTAEIAEARQSHPARLPKVLERELDWITMKALDKDRARRYETANGLARDLERYLVGEPVEAAPPSTGYRLGKFVRRHRAVLAAASAMALLLIAGIVATTWMAVRARRAEQEARAVDEFLRQDVLAQASAFNQPGTRPDPNLTVRTALDRAAAHIPGKFANQPLVEAAIRQTIGSAYTDLGVYDSAERQFDRAVFLRRTHLGETNEATLLSMGSLAAVYERSGKLKEAESLYSHTLDAAWRVLGAENPSTLKVMNGLAVTCIEQGKYEKALQIYERLVPIEQRVFGETDFQTLRSMGNFAALYSYLHQKAKAKQLLARTLELERQALGPDNPETLGTMDNLGIAYSDEGDYARAEPILAAALEAERRILGENHRHTIATLTALGDMHRKRGDYSRAEELFTKAITAARRGIGEEHPDSLQTALGLALTYEGERRYAEADALLSKTAEISRRVVGPEHPDTLYMLLSLGRVRLMQGRYSEAQELLRQTLSAYEKSSPNEWQRYYCQGLLGASLMRQKQFAEAEPLLLAGFDGLSQHETELAFDERKYIQSTGEQVAELYSRWGNSEKASEWTRKLQARPAEPAVR